MPSPYDPAQLRRHYEQAAADKAAGATFYGLLADYRAQDALVLGYKAAAQAIRARDASMFNKLAYVQEAARTFEQAVALAPANAEVRFLRFSVESNLPALPGPEPARGRGQGLSAQLPPWPTPARASTRRRFARYGASWWPAATRATDRSRSA